MKFRQLFALVFIFSIGSSHVLGADPQNMQLFLLIGQSNRERFATMIGQLRKDLHAENVPVIIGELGQFRPPGKDFNAALPDISKRVPLCALVTSENLKDKGDKTHFDSPSLRIFGKRYAEAFLKLKSQVPGKNGK